MVVKAILGDGERVREREREGRSEGVESECEARVKASFGGIATIGKVVIQGISPILFFNVAGVAGGLGVGGGRRNDAVQGNKMNRGSWDNVGTRTC